MSREQREAFLADVHVGILAIDEPGRGPLALPIWYEYVDGVVEIGLDGTFRKAELLRAAGRATFTVQDEAVPYRYVCVEGPVEVVDQARDVLALATRYLGPEFGPWYAEQNPPAPTSVLARLTPEHWRTGDFGQGVAEALAGGDTPASSDG